METPEDRFYNPATINGWFAVSSVLVVAATVAAVVADQYDREWKHIQGEFLEMERERAEKAVLLRDAKQGTLPPGAAAVRDRLVRIESVPDPAGKADPVALEAAAFEKAFEAVRNDPEFPAGAAEAARSCEKEAAALRTPEFAEKAAAIAAARQAAEDARFKAEMQQRELQARVDEFKFRMDHARSHGHGTEAAEAERVWKEIVGKEAEAHSRMDSHAREKQDRADELKALSAPVTRLEDRARRLWEASGVAPAERKIGSWIARGLRDAPLIPPAAPVMKIEQRVFPELTLDYNFMQVPRIDRCMTCHTGIDKVRVEPNPKDPSHPKVVPVYGEKDADGKEIPRVFRTHPRPELFVSSVSKHALDRVGCTVCHEGQGMGLSFTDAYHTPDSPEQEKEWKEKFHWHAGESWTFPMLPMRHIESSCFKCHRDPEGFAPADKFAKEIPSAPKWNRGLEIIESRGCFGCHRIDGYSVPGLDKWLHEIKDPVASADALAVSTRKTGPGFRHLPAKWTSEEAVWKWIWRPRALRPATRMPHFFGLPNNTGSDPLTGVDYDLRTRTEVWGLVAYLWDSAEPYAGAKPTVKGDAGRGKLLFAGENEDDGEITMRGCVACHSTKDFPHPEEGGKVNDFGPDLSTLGSKTSEAWLYDWLKNPAHYWPGTRMPDLRLDDQEAADLAAYLMTLRDEAWEKERPPPPSEAMVRDLALEAARVTAAADPGFDPVAEVEKADFRRRLRMVGKRAVTQYSCFGCHEVKGFEFADRIGTQLGGNEGWGSKDPDRLDFGVLEDSKAVATFAAGWGAKWLPHRRPEWAEMKLLHPRVFDAGVTKQPHEKLLMPDFGLTEDEAEAVATVLLSLQKGEVPVSKRPVRGPAEIQAEKMKWIVRKYNCYGCHTVTREEVVQADGTRADLPRGRDIRPWLGDEKRDFWPPTLGGEGIRGEGFKVQAAWFNRFMMAPGENLLRFWIPIRMPTFPLTQAERNAMIHGFAAAEGVAPPTHVRSLQQRRAVDRGVALSEGVPFPFDPSGARSLSGFTESERAATKALFEKMECMKCHPTKAIEKGMPLPSGLAPPLHLGHDRLRYEWVKAWLDDPAQLQPGAKMPAFWRPSGPLLEPLGDAFEGNPHEQMRRLSDYVLDLGRPKEAGTR